MVTLGEHTHHHDHIRRFRYGKCFALLDRNVVSNPWRKVWVVRHAATADEPAHFKCYFEESGDVIDEPENGVVKAIHCGLAC